MTEVLVRKGRVIVDGRPFRVKGAVEGAEGILSRGRVKILRLEEGDPVSVAAGILAALASEGSTLVLGELEVKNPVLLSSRCWIIELLNILHNGGRIPRGSPKIAYRRVATLERLGLVRKRRVTGGRGRPHHEYTLTPIARLILLANRSEPRSRIEKNHHFRK